MYCTGTRVYLGNSILDEKPGAESSHGRHREHDTRANSGCQCHGYVQTDNVVKRIVMAPSMTPEQWNCNIVFTQAISTSIHLKFRETR